MLRKDDHDLLHPYRRKYAAVMSSPELEARARKRIEERRGVHVQHAVAADDPLAREEREQRREVIVHGSQPISR